VSKEQKHKKILTWFIALTLTFIWGNSLMPASISGAIGGWAKDVINALAGTVGGSGMSGDGVLRKIAHATEFASLGAELVLYARLTGRLKVIGALFFGLSAAFIDETIQLFVPGRAGLIKDVWIDFSGVCVGTLIVFLILQSRKGKHQ
jgi:VanZ family protein